MAAPQSTMQIDSALDGEGVHKADVEFHEFATGKDHISASGVPLDPDEGKSIWKVMKENPRVIAYAFVANTGSLMFGYDVLVTGAILALPAFSMSFGEMFRGQLILPAVWQSLWTAFMSFGIMFGALCSGFLQDRFGRRCSYFVGGTATAIGTSLAFTSPDMKALLSRRLAFFFAKTIIGFGMGILLTGTQTYVSEISPSRLRGVLLGLFPFIVCIGQMIAITLVFTRISIMNPSAMKIPFSIQWAFSGLAILAGFILPESPSYFISKDNRTGAEKSYRRLHGSHTDVTIGLEVIQSAFDHEKMVQATSKDATYAECFKGSNARRTIIISLVSTLQYLLGVSLLVNTNYFLIMAGMSPTKSLGISQIGIGLQTACTVISWFTISWLGRRFLTLTSIAATGVVFVTMGASGFYPNNKSALTYVGAALLLVGCLTQLGVGTVWPVIVAETSSSRLRAKSAGIGFIVNAFTSGVFTIVTPYLFNADAANLGAKIGLIFAGLCLLGFILVWFVVPETGGKTFEELDYLFEKRTKTRQFKKPFVRSTDDENQGQE